MEELTTTENDATLWLRARAGERDAQERLGVLLRRVAERELPYVAAADRDDAIQEAFRSLIESQRACEVRKLGVFLKRRVQGALSTMRRKLTPTPVGIGAEDGLDPPSLDSASAGEAAGLIASELRRDVDECCRRLTDRERGMVRMRIDDDLPNAEISARTGLTMDNVRVVMHRALKKLRECLVAKGAVE